MRPWISVEYFKIDFVHAWNKKKVHVPFSFGDKVRSDRMTAGE